ncbi:MAG TPA: TonB family protein [Polyangia bacterium]|nr:TonB family protein [Polyangia bacterium]
MVAVVLALVLHAVGGVLFVALMDLTPLTLPPRAPVAASSSASERAQDDERDRPMEIESLVDELSRPDEKTAEEKAKEEQVKKEEEDKNPSGQVVDIAKPAIEERPDNAKFVSEFDSKVERETKANGRDHGGARAEIVPPVGRPDVSEPRAGSRSAAPAVEEAGRPGKPGPLAMRELERRRAEQRSVDGPQPTADGELEHAGSTGNPEAARPQPPAAESGEGGTPGARRASPGSQEAATPGLPGDRKPNLQASNDVLQHAIGKGAGSMDYLKDVDDGEATALNSKRWKHAPFFNRVKRAVADQWHPDVVYMIHDSSGHVYGFKDRITVLRIHLDPQGKLVAWQVLQSSGVDFLDDEAISAFRKAGPFPNPPKDLVDTDGQIHFNFGFAFELSGRGSVKVYKYQ